MTVNADWLNSVRWASAARVIACAPTASRNDPSSAKPPRVIEPDKKTWADWAGSVIALPAKTKLPSAVPVVLTPRIALSFLSALRPGTLRFSPESMAMAPTSPADVTLRKPAAWAWNRFDAPGKAIDAWASACSSKPDEPTVISKAPSSLIALSSVTVTGPSPPCATGVRSPRATKKYGPAATGVAPASVGGAAGTTTACAPPGRVTKACSFEKSSAGAFFADAAWMATSRACSRSGTT